MIDEELTVSTPEEPASALPEMSAPEMGAESQIATAPESPAEAATSSESDTAADGEVAPEPEEPVTSIPEESAPAAPETTTVEPETPATSEVVSEPGEISKTDTTPESDITSGDTDTTLDELLERDTDIEQTQAVIEHPMLTTPFEDYTVTEGLLLLLLLSVFVVACVRMLKGGFAWLR